MGGKIINPLKSITATEYSGLKQRYTLYLSKWNSKSTKPQLSYLNSFLKYLDKENISFRSINLHHIDVFMAVCRNKSYYKIMRDFLIKDGFVTKDVRIVLNKTAEIEFGSGQSAYIAYKQRMGIRPATIKFFIRTFKTFQKFLAVHNAQLLSQINRDICEAYMTYRLSCINKHSGKLIQISTSRHEFFILREYFKYLLKENLIIYSPFSQMKPPRRQRIVRRNSLPLDELQHFFENFPTETTENLRNWVAFNLMYCCGLRVNEAVSLDWGDLDFDNSSIKVRCGKGGYQRTVVMCAYILEIMEQYRQHAPDATIVFSTKDARRIHKTSLINAFGRIRDKMKMPKLLSLHCMRKSIGKHLLESGLDIRYVQTFLGHHSINSTATYTILNIDDLRKAILLHPEEHTQLSDCRFLG